MARVEQGIVVPQKENKGLIEKYKGFNKLTRNIFLAIGVGSAAVGFAPGAAFGLGGAAIDQGQIVAIDEYKRWKERRKQRALFKQGEGKIVSLEEFSNKKSTSPTLPKAA